MKVDSKSILKGSTFTINGGNAHFLNFNCDTQGQGGGGSFIMKVTNLPDSNETVTLAWKMKNND